jgi:hypothetical protein
MSKRMLITIGLLGLTMAGCGPAMKTAWVKPGASYQDFNRDIYECSQRHQLGPYFWCGIGGLIAKGDAEDKVKDMRRTCLRAQGWHRAELPETNPDGFEEDDDD